MAAHRAVVHPATLASSIHNSQPWSFTTDDGGLDVYADGARRLPVLDPEGRLVHLSCRAALQHAQVAARALGFLAEPVLLPDPADPGHLARLRLTTGSPSSPADHELADAISRRRTTVTPSRNVRCRRPCWTVCDWQPKSTMRGSSSYTGTV